MNKYLVLIVLLIISLQSFGQQNTLPMTPFFKDRLFNDGRLNGYKGNGVYPIIESEYDLNYKIADTSKQYYDATEILFKKHLLEFKGDNYYLTISPVIDFSYGRDLEDTTNQKLLQNTRGLFVEGDLNDKFSFMTSFFENQSYHPEYQTTYFNEHGEMYLNPGGYSRTNAVIPGGARTKPFKDNGFDYAYAIGNIVYRPIKNLVLLAGNNQHFIGDGYRSILLSDNSYSAPYFEVRYSFQPKWEYTYLRSKHLNLLRRPASTTVESYYAAKGYAVNYLTFTPHPNYRFSLFEGNQFSRGDSIQSHFSHPLYFNPIPGINSLILPDSMHNSLLGLNISANPFEQILVYGQLAYNTQSSKVGTQLGIRYYEPFQIKNWHLQVEYNNVPKGVFSSSNPRLNFTHYNLPLVHTKGQGFQEFILRTNYEYQRAYVHLKVIYYLLDEFSSVDLLPIYHSPTYTDGSTINTSLEIGYRFNRKMNLTLFGTGIYRSDNSTDTTPATVFTMGVRTNLINHYFDF